MRQGWTSRRDGKHRRGHCLYRRRQLRHQPVLRPLGRRRLLEDSKLRSAMKHACSRAQTRMAWAIQRHRVTTSARLGRQSNAAAMGGRNLAIARRWAFSGLKMCSTMHPSLMMCRDFLEYGLGPCLPPRSRRFGLLFGPLPTPPTSGKLTADLRLRSV